MVQSESLVPYTLLIIIMLSLRDCKKLDGELRESNEQVGQLLNQVSFLQKEVCGIMPIITFLLSAMSQSQVL